MNTYTIWATLYWSFVWRFRYKLKMSLQTHRHFECENLIEISKKRTDKERSICRWAHSQKQVFLKDRGTYWLSGKLMISKKSIFQNPDIIFSSYFLNATINYYVLWRKIASKLLNHFPIVQITDQIFPPVPHYCLLKWKSHRVHNVLISEELMALSMNSGT